MAALNKPGVGFLQVCASLVQQLLHKLIIVVFLLLPRWIMSNVDTDCCIYPEVRLAVFIVGSAVKLKG